MKKNQAIIRSLAVFLILILFGSGLLARPALAQPLFEKTAIPTQMSNTILAVTLSKSALKVGDEFDITVTIQTDSQTRGAQFDLSFDPALVEIQDGAKEGDFYAGWALKNGASSIVIPQPIIDNKAGKVSVAGIAILGAAAGTGGPTGKGTLMIFHAKAKGDGVANFKLGDAIVANAGDPTTGEAIALGGVKLQDGSVGIGSGQAASTQSLREATPPGPQAASTVTPEATIVKRTSLNDPQSSSFGGGLPLDIILPVVGALIIGIGAFFFLRRR